jgi:hypothetical protein
VNASAHSAVIAPSGQYSCAAVVTSGRARHRLDLILHQSRQDLVESTAGAQRQRASAAEEVEVLGTVHIGGTATLADS